METFCYSSLVFVCSMALNGKRVIKIMIQITISNEISYSMYVWNYGIILWQICFAANVMAVWLLMSSHSFSMAQTLCNHDLRPTLNLLCHCRAIPTTHSCHSSDSFDSFALASNSFSYSWALNSVCFLALVSVCTSFWWQA